MSRETIYSKAFGIIRASTNVQEALVQAMAESVVLETNMGDIQLELYWDHAPRVCHSFSIFCFCPTAGFFQTCENFAQLAKRGYYNGVVFHRIVAVCRPSSDGVKLRLPFLCEGLYGSRR